MARRKKLTEPRCTWTLDASEYGDSWDTDCGEKWCFEEGGPRENNCRYCHGCGRPLRIVVEAGEALEPR